MRTFCLALFAVAMIGCSGGDKVPEAPMKTAADLPKDMPDQARAQAEAAMKQSEAIKNQSAPPPQAMHPSGG